MDDTKVDDDTITELRISLARIQGLIEALAKLPVIKDPYLADVDRQLKAVNHDRHTAKTALERAGIAALVAVAIIATLALAGCHPTT